MNYELIYHEFFGNRIADYLIFSGIFLASALIIKIFRSVVLSRLKKISESTSIAYDNYLIRFIELAIVPGAYAAVFYFPAVMKLKIDPGVLSVIRYIYMIITVFFIVRGVSDILKNLIRGMTKSKGDTDAESDVGTLKGISAFANIAVWIIAVIFILDNMGFEISAVVAGLGIGGVAVALAAQTILGDLFNYFVILFDRPFSAGDFIMVDEKKGVIENIGIKTTRVQSLTGEQLVFSNSDLTKSRIHNFKKMSERRIEFKFGVLYQTPYEKVVMIPSTVKEIISSISGARFDRSHFAAFEESALLFVTVYYVSFSDYAIYMDIQQKINLELMKRFQETGISFAYPTQTIFIEKG